RHHEARRSRQRVRRQPRSDGHLRGPEGLWARDEVRPRRYRARRRRHARRGNRKAARCAWIRIPGGTSQLARATIRSDGADLLAGTLAGIAFGILLARAMAGYIGGLLTQVYGVAQSVDGIHLDPLLLAGAAAMGLITSLVAAVIPARSAAGVDPVKALQKGQYQ